MINDETIARLFESDLEAGMNRVEKMKGMIVSSVQDIMYGKQINEDIISNKTPKSYKQALQEAKDTLLFDIEGRIEDGIEYDGHFDNLTDSEQMLFEINGEFNTENITNSFLEGIKETVRTSSRQTVKMFNMLVTYTNYNDLAKKAMPFLKDSHYHFDADVLVDDEVESHNKIRQMFERSEIPAYSTFSERVRFFMYNTKMDATDTAFGAENVFRQYVDTFFKKSQERALKNLSDMNGLTTGLMINSMRQELKSLEEFPSSAQYRSAKAVFDRFYNLENPNSFISIASNNDPAYKFQAQAHQSVINAIISAQKSVVIQEFLKIEFTRFGISIIETKVNEAKRFKNKMNHKIASKLFVKTMLGEKESYRLSPGAKSTFFDRSSDYNLTFNDNGEMVVTLFNKSYIYPKGQIKRGQKNNLMDEFINQLVGEKAVNQLSTVEIQKLLDDLGMTMSFDALNKFMSIPSLKKSVVEIAVHSYLILARQYSDEKENYFKPDLKLEIEFLTNGRQDNISKILKPDARGASASNENLDTVEVEDEGPAGLVFSPTTFHVFFQKLGAAQQLNSYDNRDNIVYIMEGSKENKDKFPSYIHRAMANLSKIKDYSVEQALKETMNVDAFRDEKFSAIHSNTYKNTVFTKENFIGEIFYMKGIQNKQTNKSKSYTDMTDREFSRVVLGMLFGKNYESDFYMPMEVQANRGFLPVQKMAGKRRFGITVNKDGYVFTDDSLSELEKLRKIPFHHAGRVMQQIYEIVEIKKKKWAKGKSQLIGNYLNQAKTEKIQEEWAFLQEKLDNEFIGDPEKDKIVFKELTQNLSPKKHYLEENGKILLPPLLTERMKFSEDVKREDSFVNHVRDSYLEFAEDLFSKISTEKNYDFDFLISKDWLSDKVCSLNVLGFRNPNLDSHFQLFQQTKIKDEYYAGLPRDEKIKLYHPALMTVFVTYYINWNQLTQVLSGDSYLYSADKHTGLRNLSRYMTDDSKRQAGVTTPKIEMTFRETILDKELNEVLINKRALNSRLRISHVTGETWNSIENPEVNALLESANGANSKGFEQKANNGEMMINMLTKRMMENSLGNENGYRIGNFFKLHNYSFDLKSGHLNYFNGMTQVITSEALELDEGFLHLILENQYKHAKISGPGIIHDTDLWTLFIKFKEETKSYDEADQKISKIYFDARNYENGYSLEGDIVNITVPLAAEKGNVLSINPIVWLNGAPVLDKENSAWTEIGTAGFGILTDFKKDLGS